MSDLGASIQYEYTNKDIGELLEQADTLAAFSFTSDSHLQKYRDPRHVATGLIQLGHPLRNEVWRSNSPVSKGYEGEIAWSQNTHFLFCSLELEDSPQSDLAALSKHAYDKLLRFIASRKCPYIVRAWNYLAEINTGEDDAERYRQFCLGRHQAFQAAAPDLDYPAACAIGRAGDRLLIYLLASATPGEHFENPSQTSAYQYPRQYGPRSPSFARATRTDNCIHISGTASIRGHQSLHHDDLQSQLSLTCDNIEQLLSSIPLNNEQDSPASVSLAKVYIRKPEDYPAVKAAVSAHFGDIPLIYVQGDICRQELDVEIDGLAY